MTSRRDFLAGSSLTLLGAAWPPVTRAAGRGVQDEVRGADLVEVETRHGRVRGRTAGGAHVFLGIPYGESTAGRNRFMPPRAPAPWRGVRDCLDPGAVCPQPAGNAFVGQVFPDQADASAVRLSEDCLNLNLWTPAVRDGARRAVLVTFPGEGFSRGSASAPAYDGAQLARGGDVVVITINHRLGVLGFLPLADAGAPAQFAHGGVAGLMDLTAALEWVRDHADRFGGDPRNVTLIGLSGAGAKVCSLLATRAARGLFHRAAVLSGSMLTFAARTQAASQADAVLRAVGVDRTRVAALQSVPWQRLLEVQPDVSAIRPVLDGDYLTHDPFDPVAPEESAAIPLVVSTALEDAALQLTNVELDEARLKSDLDRRFAGRGADVLALYRCYYPDRSPYLIQAQALTDAGVRRRALRQAELKASQGKGAIYVYEWDWARPGTAGRYGAVQGLDLATGFGDTPTGGDRARLAGQLSSAWLNFARTGVPASPQLPSWPGYDVTTRATLVFGTPTMMINDHRGEIRQFWQQLDPADGLA